jgi:pimeloyl-ACP methyl ester carboxylesterase
MVAHTLRMPVTVCRALLDGITTFDVERELGGVRAPVLLLWGDRDAIVSRSAQDALVSGLPSAELRVVPGCGHTPHWHDPRGFAAALAGWTADITRQPSKLRARRR